MIDKNIAVLRGGMSSEYEVSMRTGASVIKSLLDMGYSYKDITITKQGEWLESGIIKKPESVLAGVDVVFIALHGEHGEDGRIQRFLSHHKIPYTGSNALASLTALNKALTKHIITQNNITTPEHQVFENVRSNISIRDLSDNLPDMLVVKPNASGSSVDTKVGVTKAEAVDIINRIKDSYKSIIIEEYIKGREITVGVLENFRGQQHYVLPSIEILPPSNQDFYSYEAKYSGESTYFCPAEFNNLEKKLLHDTAIAIHKILDLKQYSRSDFIMRDGKLFFLEVNTLPGLTETSLFPKAIESIGANYNQLIEHLISGAEF